MLAISIFSYLCELPSSLYASYDFNHKALLQWFAVNSLKKTKIEAKRIIDFIIYTELYCIIGKGKEVYSFNKTMISSFSFATPAKTREVWLHRKGMLTKEIGKKKKKPLICDNAWCKL